VANNGYFRTSLGYTSGQLKNGWAITAAGSYKNGEGWVDRAYTEGWFYYLKVDKRLGNHILSLSAMGAPQEHGQRRYKKPLATYDADYASNNGVDASPGAYYNATYLDTNYMVNKRLRYNPDWGEYIDKSGNRIVLNEKVNYYHKPQFTIRDFWNINDKLYLSNIVYVSLGNGGGTSLKRSVRADQGFITPTGQIDMQRYYDINTDSSTAIDPLFPDKFKSYQYLRAQVNNHRWYGLLSTFNYTINDALTFSGGLDLRRYKGEHYEKIYNLLGLAFYLQLYN
jgi:hypothetical protein